MTARPSWRRAASGDEGAYVSVVGALSRYWTTISERVQGAYYMDSTKLHRLTASEEKRRLLFQQVADLAAGLELQTGTEFEASEAWTVQRLREGEGVAGGGGRAPFGPGGGGG